MKRMKLYLAGLLRAPVILLLLTSCQDEPLFSGTGNEDTHVGELIRFTTQVMPDITTPETKGVPVSGNVYPDGGSFGVFGYRLPGTAWVNTLQPDFLYNKQVTRSGSDYLYSGEEYWPDAYVRMFAYHPYATADNGITLFASSYVGNPYLEFKVKDQVTDQVDLLLAATTPALAPSLASFFFSHGLTRVTFEVSKTNVQDEVKILSFTLKNIVGAGTVSLVPRVDGRFMWTPSALYEDVKEYSVSVPGPDGAEQGLIPVTEQQITAAGFQNISSPGGTLFLIPQQITAGRSLLVVRYTVDGAERTQEIVLPATSPGSLNEWLSGKYIKYQITIRVNDSVEDVEISSVTAEANCIILEPQPQLYPAADFIQYSIPVLQANKFYDDPSFAAWNEGLTGISPSDHWGVHVIWMDKANLLSITKRNGIGSGNDPDGRFSVRIPVGNEGNALVGIYKDTNANQVQDADEPWLWSWHLWVTDYNPNRLLLPGSLTGASAEGEWEVQNGKIHRYRNGTTVSTENNGDYGSFDVWTPTTGLYAGKAMMDRNLGNTSANFPPLENNIPFETADYPQRCTPLHVLYYEYGRKDPFLSNAYRYREDGSALNTIDLYNQTVTLLFAIQNPEKYIHGRQSWAIDKPYKCYWYDPRYEATQTLSATTGKKSLFDPCPAGWRLPVNGTWGDFTKETFSWSNERRGRIYSPNGGLEIYYPADGFRAASTAEVKQTGYHGICWSCSPIPDNDKDYCFRFSSPEYNILEGTVFRDTVWQSAPVYQTDSFSVRCVQD